MPKQDIVDIITKIEDALRYFEYLGDLALHTACRYGRADIVDLLLEHSGDTTVTIAANIGRTPVYTCCERCDDYNGGDCSKSCSIIKDYVRNNNINID